MDTVQGIFSMPDGKNFHAGAWPVRHVENTDDAIGGARRRRKAAGQARHDFFAYPGDPSQKVAAIRP